eukprot:15127289-Ditylum_brightwellii.AAC.1
MSEQSYTRNCVWVPKNQSDDVAEPDAKSLRSYNDISLFSDNGVELGIDCSIIVRFCMLSVVIVSPLGTGDGISDGKKSSNNTSPGVRLELGIRDGIVLGYVE